MNDYNRGLMPRRAVILAIVLLFLAADAARADEPAVKLDVSVGFDGVFRAGAWTPVYVTVASKTPRAVILELSGPHDATHALRITLLASAGPTPLTFQLFAPLPQDLQLVGVVIRDADTGRALADARLDEPLSIGPRRFASDFADVLIGYASDQNPRLPVIDVGDLAEAAVAVGGVPGNRLPATAIGYDALDVLILGAPDLARLDPAAQRAIVDWVHAGGTLLYWPGAAPLPSSSPVGDLLPAAVGDNAVAELDVTVIESFSLSQRFSTLPVRRLTPVARANPIAPLGESATGYWIDRGRGRVMILPFDPGMLVLPTSDARKRFWRPVLERLVGPSRLVEIKPDSGTNMAAFSRMNAYVHGFGEANAVNTAINLIGDIPGIGRFGFSYVLVVLLALMIVVGPVDWLVLKKLGRQPWTVYTTAGWIALVTLGAVYAGNLLRSGDLHLRTVELVEQSDRRIVARAHLGLVYSPQTARYAIDSPPGAWWRPASAQAHYYGGGTMMTDVPFVQSPTGNVPAPMRIPIWSMRFLRALEPAPDGASPILAAELRVERHDGQPWIVGTVTNVAPTRLYKVIVSTREGSVEAAATLAPGQTVAIREKLAPYYESAIGPPLASPPVGRPPRASTGVDAAPPVNSQLSPVAQVFALNVAQQRRLTERVYDDSGTPVVVIVAQSDELEQSPIAIRGAAPIVQHRRFVRASFDLAPEPAP